MDPQLWVVGHELRLAGGDTVAVTLPGAEAEAALRHALVEGGGRLRLVGAELRSDRIAVAVAVPEAERATTLRGRLEQAIEVTNERARRPVYLTAGDDHD